MFHAIPAWEEAKFLRSDGCRQKCLRGDICMTEVGFLAFMRFHESECKSLHRLHFTSGLAAHLRGSRVSVADVWMGWSWDRRSTTVTSPG